MSPRIDLIIKMFYPDKKLSCNFITKVLLVVDKTMPVQGTSASNYVSHVLTRLCQRGLIEKTKDTNKTGGHLYKLKQNEHNLPTSRP